jgi:hypothetical protein
VEKSSDREKEAPLATETEKPAIIVDDKNLGRSFILPKRKAKKKPDTPCNSLFWKSM